MNNKKLVIVSFFITKREALLKLKKIWSLRNSQQSVVLKPDTDHHHDNLTHEEFGGSVVLIDPTDLSRGYISEIDIPLAFGMCVNKKDKSLYVTGGSVLYKVKNGKIVETLNNPLFNDLHSLTRTISGNLLVTSTGTDSILEVDFNNTQQVLWDWLATENGFNKTASGMDRNIDRDLNYQNIMTFTTDHTTHINTSLNDNPGRILATLFHQGKLIEINKSSKKVNVILEGLKSPHNIRKRSDGFMVCDTRANRVLLLDQKFNVTKILKHDFDWVQDALEIYDRETYLVADSNNNRLVLIDCLGKLISSMEWKKDTRKVASLEIVTESEAKNIFYSK